MFESLFKYPRVLARHQEGPALEARQRFLNHCSDQGLARATLLRNAREVLVIADRIDVTAGRAVVLQSCSLSLIGFGLYAAETTSTI